MFVWKYFNVFLFLPYFIAERKMYQTLCFLELTDGTCDQKADQLNKTSAQSAPSQERKPFVLCFSWLKACIKNKYRSDCVVAFFLVLVHISCKDIILNCYFIVMVKKSALPSILRFYVSAHKIKNNHNIII